MTATIEYFESMHAELAAPPEQLAQLSDALMAAEQATTTCATAMLRLGGMAIETSAALDSIEVLQATRRILTRANGGDHVLATTLLEATIVSCERCAELCSKHAAHHDHCRLHAEAARTAADASRQVLSTLRA